MTSISNGLCFELGEVPALFGTEIFDGHMNIRELEAVVIGELSVFADGTQEIGESVVLNRGETIYMFSVSSL